MKSYVKLSIISIFMCLTGCTITDKAVNSANGLEVQTIQYKFAQVKIKSSKKKIKAKSIDTKLIQQKPKIKKLKSIVNKPQEVERVCFDTQGKAHNCNYKIPKPY